MLKNLLNQKSIDFKSGVGFSIRRILSYGQRPLADIQKSPSLKVGFDLVKSIGFSHRFLK